MYSIYTQHTGCINLTIMFSICVMFYVHISNELKFFFVKNWEKFFMLLHPFKWEYTITNLYMTQFNELFGSHIQCVCIHHVVKDNVAFVRNVRIIYQHWKWRSVFIELRFSSCSSFFFFSFKTPGKTLFDIRKVTFSSKGKSNKHTRTHRNNYF